MPETSHRLAAPHAAREVETFRELVARIRAELHKAIIGLDDVIDQILTALFAGGHVLIEGVPGTGKTLMVRSLARTLNLSFNRIQFTVDVMPADITGTRMVVEDNGRRSFAFFRGPIFANVLLADEINRATPKTQSALLEAMQEMQVTSGGETYRLSAPFFVLATLNPIEMEGTYPLPEAQLDRFLFKVFLPYPPLEELQRIIADTTGPPGPEPQPVFSEEEAPGKVEAMRALVREVIVPPHLERYASLLVWATIPSRARGRTGPAGGGPACDAVEQYVAYGSSPRGGQALLLGARVRALLDGRANVAREDIDAVAVPALNHRLVLNFAARADGVDARDVVREAVRWAQRLVRA